jgi:leucyl aminopeptidase (aminopeptidase T)
MKNSDLLINFAPLFAQKAVSDATKAGLRVASVSRDVGFLKRGLLGTNWKEVGEMHEKISKILRNGKTLVAKSEAGTDLTMTIEGRTVMRGDGIVREPGEMQWLPGAQINQAAIEESINGVAAFDWTVSTSSIPVKTPVKVTITDGRITKFEGGEEAKRFEQWFASLNDPRMYWNCHYSFGLNPNYTFAADNLGERERVMGVMFLGFGSQLSGFQGKLGAAAAHSDNIMRSPTVWVDGKKLLENNKFLV